MVRKKNLTPGTAYRVRVRARDRIDWNPFLPPAVVKVRTRHMSLGRSMEAGLLEHFSKCSAAPIVHCPLHLAPTQPTASPHEQTDACPEPAADGSPAARGAGGRLCGGGVGAGGGGGEVSGLTVMAMWQ